jgi:hypothetical protein
MRNPMEFVKAPRVVEEEVEPFAPAHVRNHAAPNA